MQALATPSPLSVARPLLPLAVAALGALGAAAFAGSTGLFVGIALVAGGLAVSIGMARQLTEPMCHALNEIASAAGTDPEPAAIIHALKLRDEEQLSARRAAPPPLEDLGAPLVRLAADGAVEGVSRGWHAFTRTLPGSAGSDPMTIARQLANEAARADGAAPLLYAGTSLSADLLGEEDGRTTIAFEDIGPRIVADALLGQATIAALLDAEGRIMRASKGLLSVFGLAEDSSEGMPFADIAADHEARAELEAALRQGSGTVAASLRPQAAAPRRYALQMVQAAGFGGPNGQIVVAIDLGSVDRSPEDERGARLAAGVAAFEQGPHGDITWVSAGCAALLGLGPGDAASALRKMIGHGTSPAPSASGEEGIVTTTQADGAALHLLTCPVTAGLTAQPGGPVLNLLIDVSALARTSAANAARVEALLDSRRAAVSRFASAFEDMAGGEPASLPEGAEIPEGFEDMAASYNRAAAELRSARDALRTRTSALAGSADAVSRTAQDMAERAESQAATLEQSATALEELAASVRAAAQRTGEIRDDIAAAEKSAREGGDVVRTAVEAMGEIASSSNAISQIIGLIDDIAFQTNLLALNAGVEAARAGDAGRGFAVVASEVRALAQRSSDAAKQIKDLISTGSAEVEKGVALVDRTGAVLESIIAAIDGINSRFREVDTSTREQAEGIAEVSAAVSQLETITQENAAIAEENIATGRELKDGLDALTGDVGGQGAKPGPAALPATSAKPAREVRKPAVLEQREQLDAAARGVAAVAACAEDDWTDF